MVGTWLTYGAGTIVAMVASTSRVSNSCRQWASHRATRSKSGMLLLPVAGEENSHSSGRLLKAGYGDFRLRDRGRRLGRQRARQPAERGRQEHGLRAGGRPDRLASL